MQETATTRATPTGGRREYQVHPWGNSVAFCGYIHAVRRGSHATPTWLTAPKGVSRHHQRVHRWRSSPPSAQRPVFIFIALLFHSMQKCLKNMRKLLLVIWKTVLNLLRRLHICSHMIVFVILYKARISMFRGVSGLYPPPTWRSAPT